MSRSLEYGLDEILGRYAIFRVAAFRATFLKVFGDTYLEICRKEVTWRLESFVGAECHSATTFFLVLLTPLRIHKARFARCPHPPG